MGARQCRQRPRSSSQPSTGRLSRQPTGSPQDGQHQAGRTIDSPRGTRWMTTLANDPKASPSSPARVATVSGFMGSEAYRCRPSGAGSGPQAGGRLGGPAGRGHRGRGRARRGAGRVLEVERPGTGAGGDVLEVLGVVAALQGFVVADVA